MSTTNLVSTKNKTVSKFTNKLKSAVKANQRYVDSSFQQNMKNTNSSFNASNQSNIGFKSFQSGGNSKRFLNHLGKSLLKPTNVKSKDHSTIKDSNDELFSPTNSKDVFGEKASIKELIENTNVEQKALSLIDDLVDLMTDNELKEQSKGNE